MGREEEGWGVMAGGRGLCEKEGSEEGRKVSENPMVRRAKMLEKGVVFLTR